MNFDFFSAAKKALEIFRIPCREKYQDVMREGHGYVSIPDDRGPLAMCPPCVG